MARRCRDWWTRRRIIIAASVLAVILLPPAGFATVLLVSYAGHVADHAHTRGQDALWLGHAWVDGRRTSTDVDALAHRLGATGIRDVYVHIGPLNNDGTLDADRYPTASALLSRLAKADHHIVVQAWLGNVVGADRLNLGSRATRQNVTQSARQALAAGFEGVHLDLEPIPTGSRDFLAVLETVHAVTRERNAVLSVAAEAAEPAPGLAWFTTTVIRPQWWTPDYLAQVAAHVNQVAIMSYDTALPSERLYGGFVRRQTEVALDAVPPTVDLLIGVPAFHTNNLTHRANAETVAAAIRGVRLAVSDEEERQHFGVALYVDFAATERDWRDYIDGWVAPAMVRR